MEGLTTLAVLVLTAATRPDGYKDPSNAKRPCQGAQSEILRITAFPVRAYVEREACAGYFSGTPPGVASLDCQ